MTFIYENPISESLKKRFKWTDIPLIYQGEAGMHCQIPVEAMVDYERDIIFVAGGGGFGRITNTYQPHTQVLYWKGVPVRCQILIGNKPEVDRKIPLLIWNLNELYIPNELFTSIEFIISVLDELSKIDQVVSLKNSDRQFNSLNLKIIKESFNVKL